MLSHANFNQDKRITFVMRQAITSFTAFISLIVLGGCGASNQLGTIGGEVVTLREFEEVFSKNNGGWERAAQSSLEERKDFLDLFIKYKLKLQEANARGLLQDTAIQNELAAYKASVTSTYILEKELIGPGLKNLYDRRMQEIRASHILFRVAENAAPAETLAAYRQALELCSRALTADFDSLARKVSQDPSAGSNGGDLGWFTQGRTVRPFEDAAYTLEPGQVTALPIRTRFGYHVLKVTDRRKNEGSVQVSQMVKRFFPKKDTAQVEKEASEIYEMILARKITFEDAVERFSEDEQSRDRLGLMGAFERTRLPQDLGELFFSSPVKTVLPPYRTPYGLHIFRVNEKSPAPSFEQAERELRQSYQTQYYASDYDRFVHGLKKKYDLSFDVILRHALTRSLDSTKTPLSEDWTKEVNPEWLPKALFTHAGTSYTVRQFLDHLRYDQELQNSKLSVTQLDAAIDNVAASSLLEYHSSTAVERHPTFAKLMKEYEDGVLIYRMDQDEIWQKVQVNDSLLEIYYQETKDQYILEDRVNLAEIHVPTDSAAMVIRQRIAAGEDFGILAETFTTRPGFKEKQGEWGLLPIRSNSFTEFAGSMAVDSVSAPVVLEGGWSIIKILAKEPSRIKTFEEARPEVTSKFQEHASKERERQWIESLKARYGVTVNPERLSDAFKSRPSS
ncbi:MAG: peptidylprolyl isomerase [Bacteroidota bacterium]